MSEKPDIETGFYAEVRVGRNGEVNARVDRNSQGTVMVLDQGHGDIVQLNLDDSDLARLELLFSRVRAADTGKTS